MFWRDPKYLTTIVYIGYIGSKLFSSFVVRLLQKKARVTQSPSRIYTYTNFYLTTHTKISSSALTGPNVWHKIALFPTQCLLAIKPGRQPLKPRVNYDRSILTFYCVWRQHGASRGLHETEKEWCNIAGLPVEVITIEVRNILDEIHSGKPT